MRFPPQASRTGPPAGTSPTAGTAYSLRRRLIACVLGASVVAWSVSLGIVTYLSWQETSDLFDDALKETARLALVLNAAAAGRDPATPHGAAVEKEPAKLRLYYQIVDDRGTIMRRAEHAPDRPFSAERDKRDSYRNVWIDGQAWRVYLARADGEAFQVQVGQPWNKRLSLLRHIASGLLWPMLALLVLLSGSCWWIIRRLLRPIEATAERIRAKSAADLAPVATAGEPRELQPIVQSLNVVLGRLSQALDAERRFTADAAHELRTPLAALRMRIQLMQRQRDLARPRSDPGGDGTVTLASLRDEVDRCTALVESLLVLARLDPENPESLGRINVDLPILIESVVEEVTRASPAEVRIDCRESRLRAEPALLRTALRVLLDNALRYGPTGGPVTVDTFRAGSTCMIAISDRGPGVAPDDRARLGERFFRILGSGKTGSGLGLSIVTRIAALHEGAVSFDPGPGDIGLRVVLRIPDPG
ncbi:MAG: ATP-binding protein [Xylophilus ampelinus]